MIKFIPHRYPLSSRIGLGEAVELIHNKSNEALSAQLNNRFEGKRCSVHPIFENTIVVNVSNGDSILSVETYCCDNFKQKLEVIAQNSDPFSNVEGDGN